MEVRGDSWMLFVDGENFAKAGQRALQAGGVAPVSGALWRRDVYLWAPVGRAAWYPLLPQTTSGEYSPLRRAYYFTSDDADEPEWTQTRLAIRDLGFDPRLFRRRKGRSKAVDVALASDVLTLGADGQYEVAVIVAGDGDYVPLVEAVKRLGLRVGVAFLAKDTSPELRIAADAFTDLTEPLVSGWKMVLEIEARHAANAEKMAPPEGEAS